jgi:hypothetical protein
MRLKLRTIASLVRPYLSRHSDFDAVMENTRTRIKERYRKAYISLKEGRKTLDDQLSRISAFVKWEKMSETKADESKPPRMIQFRSYEYMYLLKSFILNHSLAIKDGNVRMINGQDLRTVYTKTYDNAGVARVLMDSWNMFRNPIAVCVDESKFDGHYIVALLEAEHEYWLNVFENNRVLEQVLKKQLINKGYTKNGLKYKTKGYRMSGEYTTSEGNTTTNYGMLSTWCEVNGVTNYRIHVNGDDSVIIMEHDDYHLLDGKLDQFKHFNMECKIEVIADTFQQISYCQTSPIRVLTDGGSLDWRMIRNPLRCMSRSCYCDLKYLKCLDRFIAGVGLCELAVNKGVPILQAWSCWMLDQGGYQRPLGSVDKNPAIIANRGEINIVEITMETRRDFEIAFGYSIEQQVAMEESLAGDITSSPNLKRFINKYKKFHLN